MCPCVRAAKPRGDPVGEGKHGTEEIFLIAAAKGDRAAQSIHFGGGLVLEQRLERKALHRTEELTVDVDDCPFDPICRHLRRTFRDELGKARDDRPMEYGLEHPTLAEVDRPTSGRQSFAKEASRPVARQARRLLVIGRV